MKKSSNLITNCAALLFTLAFSLSSHIVLAAVTYKQIYVDLKTGNNANNGTAAHPVKTLTKGLTIANNFAGASTANSARVTVLYDGMQDVSDTHVIDSASGEVFPLQVGERVRLEGDLQNARGPSQFIITYTPGDGDVAVNLTGDKAEINTFTIKGFDTSITTSGDGQTKIAVVQTIFSSRNRHFIIAGARETLADNYLAAQKTTDGWLTSSFVEPWADIKVLANKKLRSGSSDLVTTGIFVGDNAIFEANRSLIRAKGTVITAGAGALINLTDGTSLGPWMSGSHPTDWLNFPNQFDSTDQSTIVLTDDAFLIADSVSLFGDDLWVINARDTSSVSLTNTYIERLGDRSSVDPSIGGAIKIADGSLEITKRESSGLIIPLENTINIDGGTAIYVSSEFAVISLNDLEINAKNKATGIRFEGTPTIRAQLWRITFNGLRYGYLFQKVTDAAKFNIWNNHFNTVTDGSHDAIRMSYCRPGSGTMNVLGNYFFPEIQGADSTGRYTSGSKIISGPTTVGTLKNFALLPDCSVKVRN